MPRLIIRNKNARPPILNKRFAILLAAQACFGYSFSCFFLLPQNIDPAALSSR